MLGPPGLVLLVGAIFLVRTGYTITTVASRSMEPTYRVGERLILTRITAGEVRRGDAVLYQTPDRYQGRAVLQRVIGMGGDHVVEQPGAPVVVNGRAIAEPYLRDGDPSGGPAYDVVVPAGRLFLLGDHRADAYDSRYFLGNHSGTVAAGDVLARVTADRIPLLELGLAALLGLLLALAGLALGIAARVVRRKSLRTPTPLVRR